MFIGNLRYRTPVPLAARYADVSALGSQRQSVIAAR